MITIVRQIWIPMLLAGVLSAFGQAPDIQVGICVHVRGYEGEPVPGAQVRVALEQGGVATQTVVKDGSTSTNGDCCLHGRTSGYLSAVISKEGFYTTRFTTTLWENVGTVLQDAILVRREDPVALFARHVDMPLPVLEEPAAFDFLAHDWLPPFGTGQHAHVFFQLKRERAGTDNFQVEMHVSFDRGGGILEFTDPRWTLSELTVPHHAPEAGYQPRLSLVVKRTSDGYERTYDHSARYFFTCTGTGERRLFGKIHGLRVIGGLRDDPRMEFTYYLNPTGSRNLEFDPKQNLFTNLTSMEEVRMP